MQRAKLAEHRWATRSSNGGDGGDGGGPQADTAIALFPMGHNSGPTAVSCLVARTIDPPFLTFPGIASPVGQGAMLARPERVRTGLGHSGFGGRSGMDQPGSRDRRVRSGLGAAPMAPPPRLLGDHGGVLGLIRWLGQDVGGLLTGMATDPNIAVPLALWAWVGSLGARERVGLRKPATPDVDPTAADPLRSEPSVRAAVWRNRRRKDGRERAGSLPARAPHVCVFIHIERRGLDRVGLPRGTRETRDIVPRKQGGMTK